MEWLKENYEKILIENSHKNIDYIKRWRPLLESKRYEFKLDFKIFDMVIEDISEFVEIFTIIDGMRPIITALGPRLTNPLASRYYEPEGWIEREEVINLFFIHLKNYEQVNQNMNFEIEKEYYNILTNKVTYLLKTEEGLKMDYDVKKEYEEKYIKDIKEIVEDIKKFILELNKRSQIERKLKMKRLLNSK